MNNFLGLKKSIFDAENLATEVRNKTDGGKRLNSDDLSRFAYQSSHVQSRLGNEILFVLADRDGKESEADKRLSSLRSGAAYVDQFITAMKNGIRPDNVRERNMKGYEILINALTETGEGGAEGGFLVPDVFDGLVELLRDYTDLGELCTIAPVTSLTGWRGIEEAAAAIPLDEMPENVESNEVEAPEFVKIPWILVPYGGFITVVQNFFDDTAINTLSYLARWFGKKVSLRNAVNILALLNTLPAVSASSASDLVSKVKAALETGLDPAISAGASVILNQTAFALYSSVVNATTGVQLMVSDYTLRQYKPVVISDALWPNDLGGTAPCFVGSMQELVTLFKWPAFELASDGGKGKVSWRNHTIEVRGVYRMDAELADQDAGILFAVDTGA